MDIVEPPEKPEDTIAEAFVFATHENEPGETFRTQFWIGRPYKDGDHWICEEFVEGFSQRKVPGASSVEALAGALTVARIDFEMLIALGWQLSLTENPEGMRSDEVLRKLFALNSSMGLQYSRSTAD